MDLNPGETLEDVAREEQALLWDDLDRAVASALNGRWSIGCDSLKERIVAFAKILGPTPWDEIQVPLLRSGVYETILKEAGIDCPPIDWDAVRRTEEYIARPLPGRQAHNPD